MSEPHERADTLTIPKGTRVRVHGLNPAGQPRMVTGPVAGYNMRCRPPILFVIDEAKRQLMVECHLYEGTTVELMTT